MRLVLPSTYAQTPPEYFFPGASTPRELVWWFVAQYVCRLRLDRDSFHEAFLARETCVSFFRVADKKQFFG